MWSVCTPWDGSCGVTHICTRVDMDQSTWLLPGVFPVSPPPLTIRSQPWWFMAVILSVRVRERMIRSSCQSGQHKLCLKRKKKGCVSYMYRNVCHMSTGVCHRYRNVCHKSTGVDGKRCRSKTYNFPIQAHVGWAAHNPL